MALSSEETGLTACCPDREDVDKEIEHHKTDQLDKQKDGKGHWKGELASNSESAVRSI